MRHQESTKPPVERTNALYALCLIGFVFALHVSLPVYYNSSFLGTFTTEKIIGLIYIVGSAGTIIGFLLMHRLLERWGNYRVAITMVIVEAAAFWGLSQATSIGYAAPLFVVSIIGASMIGLTIDIFLERYTTTRKTGGVRGLYLTVVNSAWILAPLLGGYVLNGDDYRSLYIAGLLFLIPLVYLITRNLGHFHDPAYKHASLHSTLKKVLSNRDLRRLFSVNIIINIFYAWMVIYTPIYLHKTIGFSWEAIGFLLTIMLIPFVLVEIPAGRLADSKLGEKELMSVGFAITGIATIALAFIVGASFWIWALALFMTRIGAALTEVMIETYFFKKVPPEDANMLGAFRVTRPISTIIAPIFATVGLFFTDDRGLFVILGVICISAIVFTMRIRDTG